MGGSVERNSQCPPQQAMSLWLLGEIIQSLEAGCQNPGNIRM